MDGKKGLKNAIEKAPLVENRVLASTVGGQSGDRNATESDSIETQSNMIVRSCTWRSTLLKEHGNFWINRSEKRLIQREMNRQTKK
jgi:hypothetical protein